jgi:hypothetical protein
VEYADLRIFNRDGGRVGVATIAREQIRRALEEYDRRWPANDFPRTAHRPHVKTWRENEVFRWAVWHTGRCYPPKQILRLAMDPPLGQGQRFFGGHQSGHVDSVLTELGFEIILKKHCPSKAGPA